MPYRRQKLLQDILSAGAAIQSFVHGRTLEDYRRGLMVRSAVERQLEIVGEAPRRLVALDSVLATRISAQESIIAFRNIIAHGYDVLDDTVVWGIIEDDLPRLLTEAQMLLDELNAGA